MYKHAIGIAFGLLLLNGPATAACTTWPTTLTNGNTADANQVMNNFNYASGCLAPQASPSFTGHVLISAPTDSGFLTVYGNGAGSIAYLRSASTADRFLQFIETGSGSTTMAYFEVFGAGVGSIVSNNYGTAYNTTSDERLKDWRIPQKNYADAIRDIWVGDFKWKKSGKSDFGVRAQQVFPYFPGAIQEPANDQELWQADYGRLAPLALWGVKDLYSITDAQKRTVSITSEEVRALRGEMVALRAANDNQTSEIHDLRAHLDALERQVRIRTVQR